MHGMHANNLVQEEQHIKNSNDLKVGDVIVTKYIEDDVWCQYANNKADFEVLNVVDKDHNAFP